MMIKQFIKTELGTFYHYIVTIFQRG